MEPAVTRLKRTKDIQQSFKPSAYAIKPHLAKSTMFVFYLAGEEGGKGLSPTRRDKSNTERVSGIWGWGPLLRPHSLMNAEGSAGLSHIEIH